MKTLRQLFDDLGGLQRKMQSDEGYNERLMKLTNEAVEYSKQNVYHVEVYDFLIGKGATDEEALWIYGTINGIGAADSLLDTICDAITVPKTILKLAIREFGKNKAKEPC